MTRPFLSMHRQRCAALLLLAASATRGSSGPEMQAVQPEAASKSHYVANSGDDAGPGSKTQPWKTLGRLANLTLVPGDTIYLTSGDTWTEQLALGGTIGGGMAGCMDKETECGAGGNCSFVGWALDCDDHGPPHGGKGCQLPSHSAALPAVKISVQVDGTEVASSIAKNARPDLVTAGAAPDPLHGFNMHVQLAHKYLQGNHRIAVVVVGCPTCVTGWTMPGGVRCLCDGATCPCKPPTPGTGPPPPPPIIVTGTDPAGPRPIIRLDGTKTALDDVRTSLSQSFPRDL